MSGNDVSHADDTSVADDEDSFSQTGRRRQLKRKTKNSPPSSARPQKIATPGSPQSTDFTTPNPFAVLPVDPEPGSSQEQNKEVTPKPPPIFIKNLSNFSVFCTAISNLIGEENFSCQSKINQVVLRTTNSGSYRKAIHYLKEQKASYHTYQNPEERPFRVVIRGLHPTTPTDAVHKELEELGYNVRTVTNAHHPITKSPLPIFFVDIVQDAMNKNIFDLRKLYYSRIRVEEPYKRQEIVQCQRCQTYGHTRTYCNHPPRCVRCAGHHESGTCNKTRETPATCALCGGAHPASFKGCTTYKDLQRQRRPRQQQPPTILPAMPTATSGLTNRATPPHPATFPQLTSTLRTAQSVQLPTFKPQPQPRQPRQHQQVPVATGPQVCYSQVVSGPRRPTRPIPPPPPQVYSTPNMSEQLTSFLDQFTSVANQLILAVTSLVTLLQNIPR